MQLIVHFGVNTDPIGLCAPSCLVGSAGWFQCREFSDSPGNLSSAWMRLLQRLTWAIHWFEDLRPGLILHKAAFSYVDPVPTNSQQHACCRTNGQVLRTTYKVPGEELLAFYGMETIVLAFHLVSSRN